ncbi:UNVERIFIED_CONTAM: hypothetical protein HHA_230160 [Hammondia hammondi]|eukprot:XP_008889580.1 hypothetical protein HHA_230160 [Hammondia hammondi]
MESRAAEVVYATGLKHTDPATRCFILNITPGVSERQLEKQLNNYGRVQVYTYQPATVRFPGWAWVGYHHRDGVNNLLSMSEATQKATAEFTAKLKSEAPLEETGKPKPEVDTLETSATRVDTDPEALGPPPEKQSTAEEHAS